MANTKPPPSAEAEKRALQEREQKDPPAQQFANPEAPNLDPDIRVVLAMVLSVAALFGIYVYYRVDLRNGGPFASYVNDVILGGDPHKQLWLGVVQPEVKASMDAVKTAWKAARSTASSATSTAASAVSSARDEL